MEFEDKLFMIHLIKCFAEIKQDNVSLFTFFQVPMDFLNKRGQLSFIGPFLSENHDGDHTGSGLNQDVSQHCMQL